jgi:hypothetical protein
VFRRRTPPPGLHRCCVCRDDSVVPVWWEELDEQQWRMLLRCGLCETYRSVVVANDEAKAYDRDLQRGMDQIAASLERCEHERMAAELRVFVAALERDLIDAADFAPR